MAAMGSTHAIRIQSTYVMSVQVVHAMRVDIWGTAMMESGACLVGFKDQNCPSSALANNLSMHMSCADSLVLRLSNCSQT
eukprot:scaffold16877_cov19-Tisochrysis_lutea.AAC.5